MNKPIIIAIILILLAGNIFLGFQYYYTNIQLQKIKNATNINTNVLSFDKLFIDKVLKAQGEVSSEDRLKLETAVINTKDQSLVDTYHSFLASTSEQDAQVKVLNLLSMIPDRVQVIN